MADLSKKTRFCNICIRKKSYSNDFDFKLHEYLESNCERYTYIKHDHDINPSGEMEDTHYHIVCIFDKLKRLSTYLNELCLFFGFKDPFGIKIEKTVSNTMSIQYLIHKNNPEKTQHSIDEVHCNYDRTELKCIIEQEEDNVTTLDFIMAVLFEEKTISNVVNRIGLREYKTYRLVIWDIIRDNTVLSSKFIRSIS